MIDIFLSRPNWIDEKFKPGLNAFYNFLKSLNIIPHTIGGEEKPIRSPMDDVIDLMAKCKGAVILGLPQIEIEKGRLKGEEIKTVLVLPTEWNHIEYGLAMARKMPILLLKHSNVKRGVFDRGAVNSFLYDVDFEKSDWILSNEINGAFSSWLPRVNSYSFSDLGNNQKMKLKNVNIGTYMTAILEAEIGINFRNVGKIPESRETFLSNISLGNPYCPKCSRPLNEEHASWMADGVQIGYYCKNCASKYVGNSFELYKDVQAEVRKIYEQYLKLYLKHVNAYLST